METVLIKKTVTLVVEVSAWTDDDAEMIISEYFGPGLYGGDVEVKKTTIS